MTLDVKDTLTITNKDNDERINGRPLKASWLNLNEMQKPCKTLSNCGPQLCKRRNNVEVVLSACNR